LIARGWPAIAYGFGKRQLEFVGGSSSARRPGYHLPSYPRASGPSRRRNIQALHIRAVFNPSHLWRHRTSPDPGLQQCANCHWYTWSNT
jgi:hypothetical protein